MKEKITISELISLLNQQKIRTWFDLGLFLDRVREDRNVPPASFDGSFHSFSKNIENNGIGFLTFFYSVDGVTVEINKYARLFRRNFPTANIHYISGNFKPEAEKYLPDFIKRCEIPEIGAFDTWGLYQDFFFTRLERGSRAYNRLITDFWNETLLLVEKLGNYIVDQSIALLYIVNVCSNPGNVSLCLASVLLSEYLGIPVINNNHDFYWEGGNSPIDREVRGLDPGPRDFFFSNAHLGEVFSLIRMLYPWESRSWINVNINDAQSNHLISENGHNPANVTEIGTAVNTADYMNIDKRKRINTFLQFEKILSRYQDRLIAYSATDVIDNRLIDYSCPSPILIGARTQPVEGFISENIIFLQPTRIISRKRIETGFHLLEKMFLNKAFRERLKTTPGLKITILVTGPVADGHRDYLDDLIMRFDELLGRAEESYRDRLFLALLFSELDREHFKKYFKEPAGIPDLYSISSLVLLPSKTEGRGLPIIEAAASGIPVFCRRYFPKNVYSRVIGKQLDEKDRLKVIEFDGRNIRKKHVKKILNRVFFAHEFSDELKHNRRVVIRRYSLEALNNNIRDIIYQLYLQTAPNDDTLEKVRSAFGKYRALNNYDNPDLRALLDTSRRQYIAGFGKLEFMLRLKSLIDPSFFRTEEQNIRGYLFDFARGILKKDPDYDLVPAERKSAFFNAVDTIFLWHSGLVNTRHDHSFSYRHRNKTRYPYREYTQQELTGVVNILYQQIIHPTIFTRVEESRHFFTDWNLALLQLTGSNHLAIDNRQRLIGKICENAPFAYFPGEYLIQELDTFALQSVRSRLGLRLHEPLTRKILKEEKDNIAGIYVFAQENNPGRQLNREETIEYIVGGNNEELNLIYEYGILRVVPTQQLCTGIHFAQLGDEAIKVLRSIRDENGFLITNRNEAAMMTDIIDIDRFHIGKVNSAAEANMMGIAPNSGYIQFVPAGLRTVLTYPVPVQTAHDFDLALKSKLFRDLVAEYGERTVLDEIRKDAVTNSSPVKFVLQKLEKKGRSKQVEDVSYEYITGVYEDGLPYNGVIARAAIHLKKEQWAFSVITGSSNPQPVTEFTKAFEKKKGCKSRLAWNGGYILNPELVGKLGLPESYIGSPLGLIISDGNIESPPLFNKPALLIYENGDIDIRRISCKNGISVNIGDTGFDIPPALRNPAAPDGELCFYDLLYESDFLPAAKDRVTVRLSGNRIMEIIPAGSDSEIPVIPVGLTLSFRKDALPAPLKVGQHISFYMDELKGCVQAVEAGPLLVENGKVAVDMSLEGWTGVHSIRTQAARLDYTDLRGPKIAAGFDASGDLLILAINGRIRESVGATHYEIAAILQNHGAVNAMGFDPGGSSTLVIDGVVRNISPYNHRYETNTFSLPAEPRSVSNAIIGYLRNV